MPELPVKEVRPAELHLPEIKREQIVRALSEIHLPAFELPDGVSKIDWRAIDPSSIDLGKAMAGVAAATRLGRPVIRRSRLTVAVGALVVVGLAAVALLSTPAVRERAGRAVRGVRSRMDARPGSSDVLEVEDDIVAEPVSDAAMPVEGASVGPTIIELVPVMDAAPSGEAQVLDEVTSPA